MAEANLTTERKSTSTNPMLWQLAYIFVGLFIAIAVGYAVINRGQDLSATLSVFATRFLGIFIEAVPFLLLGTVVSGLIEVFVRSDDIARFLPRNRALATVGGVFMGMVFPVCECGVVPVTRRLFTKGLPMSVGVAFLLAAPFMNPIVFASTYIAFGFGPVFIGRFVITALVAVSVGLIFAMSAKPEEVLLPQSMLHDDSFGHIPPPRKTIRHGLMETFYIAGDEFFEMGRYLIIGCLMAAGMQTLVPNDILLALGEGPLLSVVIMQAFAFILSVCSTVDAFLALAFTGTFTTGSILAFLSFGPMVDIKSTMMFLGVFKRRTVAYLILLPFLMNLFAGVFVNWLFGYF